ncbi:MAG: hypothetical protein KDA52_06275 [Planctomycetaceae bacterium]|nr:hypothetical protein [Planctomycetaceae bacterium]
MKSCRSRRLFCIVATCLCLGCGSRGDRPELGTVTGTVYMDDEPLPNVWVMFNPTGGGRTSLGRTDEEGEYELMYLEGAEGANLGSHQVVIMTYHEDEIEEMKLNNEPVKEIIPSKYNTKTTLNADVKEGSNTIDFKLEST